MSRGLLLVGHGSQRNPYSREALEAHAARIRARGGFDEVRVGLLKESPGLAEGMAAMESDEVTVVPLFASEGYYTEQIIPRELGLTGATTHRDGRVIRCTPPVGRHPGIADLLIERAREAGADARWGVVVLGHGTERNPHSARTIHAQAERVRAHAVFAEVIGLFLDQEPRLERVWELTESMHLAVTPMFMAAGWHVRETIPEDLALDGQCVRRGGRILIMGEPVGTHPGIADLIEALAEGESA